MDKLSVSTNPSFEYNSHRYDCSVILYQKYQNPLSPDKKEAKTEAAWKLTKFLEMNGYVNSDEVPNRVSKAKITQYSIKAEENWLSF